MKKNTLIFIALTMIIITCVWIVIYCAGRRYVPCSHGIADMQEQFDRSNEVFDNVSNKLVKLKQDLLLLVNQKTNEDMTLYYNSYVSMNIPMTIKKIREMMYPTIPFSEFSMTGETIDEPIINIYNKNPKLFTILGQSGFLTLVGRLLATSAWVSLSNKSSSLYLDKFWRQTDTVDWRDINTWLSFKKENCPIIKLIYTQK